MRLKPRTKRIIAFAAAVLVITMILSVLGSLSDGFQNWDTATWQLRDRNEDNLLSGNFTDYNKGDGITATAKNDGTIILDGEYKGSADNIVIPVETLSLPKGTYTFTGAPNGSTSTYNLQLTYNSGSDVVYADFDGNTFTIPDGGATVTVQIVVYPDCKINNVRIRPVLVEGSEAGDFYA